MSDPVEDSRYTTVHGGVQIPDTAADPMEDGGLLARMGTDGQKWAQEFVTRFGGDEGLMIGWFANAIEAGRDAGRAAAVQAERERIRTGVVILMEHHLGVGWDALNKVLAVIDGGSDD